MAELAEVAPRAVDERLAACRRIAIVPALNEEGNIARVIAEIRAFDPGLDVDRSFLRDIPLDTEDRAPVMLNDDLLKQVQQEEARESRRQP